MRSRKKIKMPDYPFCRQPWHIGAMLLGFGFMFTIVWAFHLLHDLGDDLLFLRFAKSDSSDRRGPTDQKANQKANQKADQKANQKANQSMMPTAFNSTIAAISPGATPVDMRIRAALVNIAGMRRVDGAVPPQFVTSGSGVLVTANGYVATTAHVLTGLGEILVRVQTPSGPRQYTAQLVKTDPNHNLAILKLVSRDLFPYLFLAPEALVLKPGDSVIAWGDPNGTNAMVHRGQVNQVEVSVTVGGYNLTHLLQTGAVSHWSQSGGPLLDEQGRVVGINVVAQSAMGVVGYAIPSDVLLAHFQDVVSFPLVVSPGAAVKNTPVALGGPSVTPPVVRAGAFGNGLGVPVGRGGRPADGWWTQAQIEYGTPKGMVSQSPFEGMGMYVAAGVPLQALPRREIERFPQPTMVPVVHTTDQRFWGYSLETLLGLLALGLISGISGGMMTMGGGIIKVTGLLLFFGYGMLLIRPVAYITNIFLYGAAVLRYRRYDLILWDSVRGLIPWAMAGVVLGYFIGNVIGTPFIRYLLGVFAALVGVRMLVEILAGRKKRQPVVELYPEQTKNKPTDTLLRYLGIGQVSSENQTSVAHKSMTRDGILGLPMGIVSGILGITGGVVEVPLQRYVVGVPLRNAIANSAVLVFFASLVGSCVAMAHGVQTGAFEWSAPVKLAIILIPGAYVGGWIGAWLTKIIPIGMLRWFYAVLMFVIAVRMFLS